MAFLALTAAAALAAPFPSEWLSVEWADRPTVPRFDRPFARLQKLFCGPRKKDCTLSTIVLHACIAGAFEVSSLTSSTFNGNLRVTLDGERLILDETTPMRRTTHVLRLKRYDGRYFVLDAKAVEIRDFEGPLSESVEFVPFRESRAVASNKSAFTVESQNHVLVALPCSKLQVTAVKR